jgi:hypothetical protein
MHEWLHIIGLCPDSLFHQDILDILILNYQEINYEKIKIWLTKLILIY